MDARLIPSPLREEIVRLAQAGRTNEAIRHMRDLVASAPECAEAWNWLGQLEEISGELPQARAALERAANLTNESALWRSVGLLCLRLHDAPAAANAFEQSVRIDPGDSASWTDLGVLHHQAGRRDEAEQCYRTATTGSAPVAQAWHNLGVLLGERGEFQAARDSHESGLALDPTLASGWNNLAAALVALEMAPQAVKASAEAIRHDPTRAEYHFTRAAACDLAGDVDTARAEYDRAIALKPDAAAWRWQRTGALPVIYGCNDQIVRIRAALEAELKGLTDRGSKIEAAYETVPIHFRLAYQAENDRSLQELFAQGVRPADGGTLASMGPAQSGQVRVAFVSRYLKNHTVGHLTEGLITSLPRDRFHVTIVHVGDARGEVASRIAARADESLTVSLSVSDAVHALRMARADVLVFPEVGMDPVTLSLAYSRFAPLQVALWGHPVTTGSPAIDAFVSWDAAEPEDAQSHYTERLVRLKGMPAAPARPAARRVGLGDAGPTRYLCPQSLFKFHPDYDRILKALFDEDRTGRLVLIEPPQPLWRTALEDRWRMTCGPDFVRRIEWTPRRTESEFLDLLAAGGQVILDPVHFGGGYTTLLALALGVPIVTLPGKFLRGRVTAGCYRAMGLQELEATSEADYVAKALEWGGDRVTARQLSGQIRERAAILFESNPGPAEWADWLRKPGCGL